MEKDMATHSSTLAWKIPQTEEPDRLQSMGSQRVGYDWATSLSLSWDRTRTLLLLPLHLLPSLISNCLDLPVETLARSWRLKAIPYKQGTKKGFLVQGSSGSCLVSIIGIMSGIAVSVLKYRVLWCLLIDHHVFRTVIHWLSTEFLPSPYNWGNSRYVD